MLFSISYIIALAILVTCLLILFWYYLYFFNALKHIDSSSIAATVPVSVLIAARNEIENLTQNLELVLNQNYPVFEVVLINDGSFDGTSDYLKELSTRYPHLKIVTLDLDERYHKGKKFAITMGIKAATYERLLFTDADCRPASDMWIQKMINAGKGKDIILGFSPLEVPKSILGSVIHYETFHTALQYATYALRNKTYMGVGRNLSYTKSLFFKHKGFASHHHLLSGDDDLFIQEAATKDNVSICLDLDAFTYSKSATTFGKWINQKRRHLSAGKLYKSSIKRLLGIYSLAQLFFLFSVIGLLVLNPSLWYIPFGALLLKWIIQWAIIVNPSQKLDSKKIGRALPFYDLLYSFYLFTFGLIKPFSRSHKWS